LEPREIVRMIGGELRRSRERAQFLRHKARHSAKKAAIKPGGLSWWSKGSIRFLLDETASHEPLNLVVDMRNSTAKSPLRKCFLPADSKIPA
jgi:hypothetical protein